LKSIFSKPNKLRKSNNLDLVRIYIINNLDHRFYPSKPEQLFPENLGDNMLKVIASFEKNCSIFDIEDNIQKFYINTVEKKTFRK